MRALFREPVVTPASEIEVCGSRCGLCDVVQLKWVDPDEEGIVQFLVREKNFNEDRVRSAIAKLRKSKSTTVQGRLDSYFTVKPAEKKPVDKKTNSPKRGAPKGASSPGAKKARAKK